MTVAVHVEPPARRPSVPHRPQSGNAVTSIKRIHRVNNEESPFLLVILLGEEGTVRVHRALCPSLEASVQLRIAVGILGLGVGYLQDALGQYPAPDLANPCQSDAWILVQHHQPIGQKGTSHGLGREVVRHLSGE